MDICNIFLKNSYFCSCSSGTKCCCGEGPGSGPTCVTALMKLTCFNKACSTVWDTLHHHISHGCFLVAPASFLFIFTVHIGSVLRALELLDVKVKQGGATTWGPECGVYGLEVLKWVLLLLQDLTTYG